MHRLNESFKSLRKVPLYGHGSKTRFTLQSSTSRLTVGETNVGSVGCDAWRDGAAGAASAGGGQGGCGPEYELSFEGHFASRHDHHHRNGGREVRRRSTTNNVGSCSPLLSSADGPSNARWSRAGSPGCALETDAVGDAGRDSLASGSDQMETQIFDVEILGNGDLQHAGASGS